MANSPAASSSCMSISSLSTSLQVLDVFSSSSKAVTPSSILGSANLADPSSLIPLMSSSSDVSAVSTWRSISSSVVSSGIESVSVTTVSLVSEPSFGEASGPSIGASFGLSSLCSAPDEVELVEDSEDGLDDGVVAPSTDELCRAPSTTVPSAIPPSIIAPSTTVPSTAPLDTEASAESSVELASCDSEDPSIEFTVGESRPSNESEAASSEGSFGFGGVDPSARSTDPSVPTDPSAISQSEQTTVAGPLNASLISPLNIHPSPTSPATSGNCHHNHPQPPLFLLASLCPR